MTACSVPVSTAAAPVLADDCCSLADGPLGAEDAAELAVAPQAL
ncbi:transcriptional regulator, partial [Micrococcus endophyticus]